MRTRSHPQARPAALALASLAFLVTSLTPNDREGARSAPTVAPKAPAKVASAKTPGAAPLTPPALVGEAIPKELSTFAAKVEPSSKVKECCGYPIGVDEGFRLSFYWLAYEEPHKLDAPDTDIYTRDGLYIGTFPMSFLDELTMEGSGILIDGRVINYDGHCKWGVGTCFDTLDQERIPMGRGVQQRTLVPFRSIAVDPRYIPIGDTVYVPELVGVALPTALATTAACAPTTRAAPSSTRSSTSSSRATSTSSSSPTTCGGACASRRTSTSPNAATCTSTRRCDDVTAAEAVWDVLAAALRGQALTGPLRVAVLGDLALARGLAERGAAVLATSGAAPKEIRHTLRPARGAAPPRVDVVRAGAALPAARLDAIVWADARGDAGDQQAVRTLAAALTPGRRVILVAGGSGGVGRLGSPVGRMLGGRKPAAREDHTRTLLCAGLVDVQQVVTGGLRPLIVTHAARR